VPLQVDAAFAQIVEDRQVLATALRMVLDAARMFPNTKVAQTSIEAVAEQALLEVGVQAVNKLETSTNKL